MTRALLLLPLLFGACDAWGTYRKGYTEIGPLWNPATVLPTAAGLYVPLEQARSVSFVPTSGEPVRVDLGDARVVELYLAPDATTVLARARLERCEDETATLSPSLDCDYDQQETVGLIARLQDGELLGWTELPPWFGDLTISPDSRFAIAVLQPDEVESGTGIVALDALTVLDLSNDSSWGVTVGFAADDVLFTVDAADATVGAVVLSESEVAVLDLTAPVPDPDVVFPLTLDADTTITPVSVALTPSGEFAMISVQGQPDLYVLDLVNPRVNILALASEPAAMAVHAASDRSILVYNNHATVEIVDHDYFDVQRIALEQPVDHIELASDFAMLWDANGGLDVYRLDLTTDEVLEYRLHFPAVRMVISPDERFAVAVSGDVNLPRMEILSTAEGERGIDDDPRSLALDGRAVGIAFSEGDGETSVLVLQEGVDTLYELSWPSLTLTEVPLAAPPTRIGEMPGGGFFITHDDLLGMVSFYTPGSEPVLAQGFAFYDLFDLGSY